MGNPAKQILMIALVLQGCKEISKQENLDSNTVPVQTENTLNATPKTYAEISIKEGGKWQGREYIGGSFKNVDSVMVPKEHTDHSWFLRYEGPGWESNKVGYRLYLDWRNAIDIFGKVTYDLILHKVGQVNFDSYHEMNTWGMILKAGKSLGIGSYGRFANGAVHHFETVDATFAEVANSPLASTVNVNYTGWQAENEKLDLNVRLAIKPDSRITHATLNPSKAISGLCTGIVKFNGIMTRGREQMGLFGHLWRADLGAR